MQKLVFITGFLILNFIPAFSQDHISSWNPEQKTYQLWQQKNWKELAVWSKKAIREGNDYFYMRMRLGVAFYERHNYQRALIHFNKAAGWNNKDPYLLEYIYYANLFSGREKAAMDISRSFSNERADKLALPVLPKFHINDLGIQYVLGLRDKDLSLFENIEDPLLNGFQTFTTGSAKLHLGFSHILSKRFHLVYRYGFIYETRYTYYQKDQKAYLLPQQNVIQHQFYIMGNQYLGGGFNFYSSLHYLPGKIRGVSSGFGMYAYYLPDYNYNDAVFSWLITKDFPYIKIGGGASFSYLNNTKYVQENVSATYYPLGNLNLYFSGDLYFKQTPAAGHFLNSGYSINYSAGFRLIYPVWVELNGSYGDLQYTTSNLGWQVLNHPDRIKYQAGVKLITSLLADKIKLTFSYYQFNAESTFQSDDGSFSPINSNNYTLHSFYGGILWNL